MLNFENGTEYRDEALKCLVSLNTRKLVDSEKIDFKSFYCGYRAALEVLQETKKMKQNEKSGVFNIYDFLDCEILKDCNKGEMRRFFLSGVFNDFENKTLVTTNGNFLVFTPCTDFEECFKNQIVSKDKIIIEGRFPAWQRVIPEKNSLQEVDNSIVEKIKAAFCQSGYKTQWQAKKGKKPFLIDELFIYPYMLFMINKFIKTQKSVKVEKQNDKSKAWVFTGDNATMIIMPCHNNSAEITDKDIAAAYWDNEKNCLVFNTENE